MKKNKGITLIALVITIIVLLILAGVTIATLTGDNGLLQKATTAKQENEDSKELELIKLAVSAAQLEGKGKLTTEDLNTELQANFNDTNTTATEIQDGWKYKGYKIFQSGEVVKWLSEEYQEVEYVQPTVIANQINTEIQIKDISKIEMKLYNDYSKIMKITGSSIEKDIWSGTSTTPYIYNTLNGGSLTGNGFSNFNSTASPDDYIGKSIAVNFSFILNSNSNYYFTFGNELASAWNTNVARYYYLKLYDHSNNLISNFIPCYKKSDNSVGMYDLMREKFYLPVYGNFIAGPEV